MNKNDIYNLIMSNDSDVDFIKDDIKISFRRVFSDVSIGYVYVNYEHIFTFIFDDFFSRDYENTFHFMRRRFNTFTWNPKGFKLVPKEI